MPGDIRKIIEAMEPRLREAFLAAVNDIRSEARLAAIIGALEDGRIDDALRALNLDDAFFAPLDDALRAAYFEGGRDALAGIPALPDPFRVRLRWRSALTVAIGAQRRGSGTDRPD